MSAIPPRHASSARSNVLTSQIYVEGFGQGAYSRLDVAFLSEPERRRSSAASCRSSCRATRYSYFGKPDAWVDAFGLDIGAFNVVRTDGTNTRRASLTAELGAAICRRARRSVEDHAAQRRDRLRRKRVQRAAEFGPVSQVDTARAQPQAAVDFRWPFMRDSGAWGTQLIEPIAANRCRAAGGRQPERQVPERGQPRSRVLRCQPVRLQPLSRGRPAGGGDACERRAARRLVSGRHHLRRADRPVLSDQHGQSVSRAVRPARSGVRCRRARQSFAPTSWLNLTYRTRLDHKTSPPGWRTRWRPWACRNSRSMLATSTPPTIRTRCSTSRHRRRRQSVLYAAQRNYTRRIVELGQLPVQWLDAA